MPAPTIDALLAQSQQLATDFAAFKTANDAALAAKDQKLADAATAFGVLKANAQARKDADVAKVEGDDDLNTIEQAGF